MARFSCLLIGLSMVACASAARVKPQATKHLQAAEKMEDACGDAVPGAVHRECYTRASFGLLPGFNTCGKAVCKCEADSVITGEDKACDAHSYDEGRQFDPEQVAGKGCACDHKANTMRCFLGAPQVCDQCKYKTKSANVDDFANMDEKVDDTFPIRRGLPEHGLPEEIQGVFWLTNQKSSSALVSFGHSEDGGGISVFNPSTGVGKVRVSGDRVWSFADLGGNMDAAARADLVYDFNFDSGTHPREARIIPTARNMSGFVNWVARQGWILQFDMYLLQCDTKPDDPFCKDEKYLSGYEKSYVWQRKTYLLSQYKEARAYKAVQVIKADGTKLPAFKHWMEYAKTEVTGGTPGQFHWREIDNSIKCE
jgi:hypothetical protein